PPVAVFPVGEMPSSVRPVEEVEVCRVADDRYVPAVCRASLCPRWPDWPDWKARLFGIRTSTWNRACWASRAIVSGLSSARLWPPPVRHPRIAPRGVPGAGLLRNPLPRSLGDARLARL